ncbi:histidine kinase [bacterium]|nr:histidine kinase [bacterium]
MSPFLQLLAEAGNLGVRASVLVFLLFVISRLPFFRNLFYRNDLDSPTQALFSLFWMVPALIAPSLTMTSAYVPFFAGRFGGPGPGYVVGAAGATWLAWKGASLPTVALHVVAGLFGGWLGSRLGPGRSSPWWLAPAGAILSLVAMDPPDRPGSWLLPSLLSAPPLTLVHVAALVLSFSFICGFLLKTMEWLLSEGERQRAQAADRVLSLAHRASGLLATGLNSTQASELAELVRDALGVPATYLLAEGRTLAFAGSAPHLHPAESLPESDQALEHNQIFQGCPDACPYSFTLLVPLQVGPRTVAHLGVLGTRQRALSPWVRESLHGLGLVLSGMLSQVHVLEQKSHLDEARFRFLQAQIRPHFLFNTLNTMAALAHDPPRLRKIVSNFSRFLRESFRQDQALVSLQHELEVSRAYLAVEQERFQERLQYLESLPDPLPEVVLPPFSLQALLENAVIHGIACMSGSGRIELRVAQREGQVEISISDNGPGFPPPGRGTEEGYQAGIGMGNVSERLMAAFGNLAALTVENPPEGGTRVLFCVPLSVREEKPDGPIVSPNR